METGTATRFSTQAVPLRHRVAFWKDAICAAFVRLDLDCDRARPFSSELAIRRTARFDLIDVGGSPQEVRRSARMIRADNADSLIIMLQRQGSGAARQGDLDMALAPNGLTILDSRRPYVLRFSTPFRQTVVKVPLLALAERLGPPESWVGSTPRSGSALARLAAAAIDEVACEPRDGVAQQLATVALDLLALALLDSRGAAPVGPGMAALRVRWARAEVHERLRDPLLTPATIAARQGVSLRLLQRLFAAEGSSLSDFICEQRLLRCRRDLQDPLHSGRTVTDIALSWGFNESSQFSRAFRRRFGCTPSDARRACGFA
ncbi:MAG: helix-turn-helix domain-containing protein [Caldimonas sp.]